MDYGFLPYLINEPIYIVREPEPKLEKEPELKLEKEPELKHLGDFKKHILFIVEGPENEVLSKEGLALLENVLTAIKLKITDVAIVNAYNLSSTEIEKAFQKFNFRILISFGVPTAVDPSILPYSVVKGSQNIILLADGLDALASDIQKKKKLWSCLQQIFLN